MANTPAQTRMPQARRRAAAGRYGDDRGRARAGDAARRGQERGAAVHVRMGPPGSRAAALPPVSPATHAVVCRACGMPCPPCRPHAPPINILPGPRARVLAPRPRSAAAKEWLEECDSAEEALAKALAKITGHTELKARSLLTAHEGFTTLMYRQVGRAEAHAPAPAALQRPKFFMESAAPPPAAVRTACAWERACPGRMRLTAGRMHGTWCTPLPGHT